MCINVACRIHVRGSGCGHNIDHNSSSVLSRVLSNLNPFHFIGFELTTILRRILTFIDGLVNCGFAGHIDLASSNSKQSTQICFPEIVL